MRDETRMVDYLAGNGTPTLAQKINRNELCPCKSGKKVKNCCKLETRYFHSGTPAPMTSVERKRKLDNIKP